VAAAALGLGPRVGGGPRFGAARRGALDLAGVEPVGGLARERPRLLARRLRAGRLGRRGGPLDGAWLGRRLDGFPARRAR
jgi:hypothetical protein